MLQTKVHGLEVTVSPPPCGGEGGCLVNRDYDDESPVSKAMPMVFSKELGQFTVMLGVSEKDGLPSPCGGVEGGKVGILGPKAAVGPPQPCGGEGGSHSDHDMNEQTPPVFREGGRGFSVGEIPQRLPSSRGGTEGGLDDCDGYGRLPSPRGWGGGGTLDMDVRGRLPPPRGGGGGGTYGAGPASMTTSTAVDLKRIPPREGGES